MSNLPLWLNNHKYEMLRSESLNGKCKIRDISNGSKKVLKITDLRDLDSKVVYEVVDKMNEVNEMNIDGLLKYKLIEVSENSLYRIRREYKLNLNEINPLKYFEDSGVYDVLNGILIVLKRLNEIGLFHSDLKPSNIFLNDENCIIIGDYLNNLLYKGRERKKPIRKEEGLCFVSYDELMGLEIDILSDIGNFGLIFYYVLSGKYAFLGSNMLETIDNIRDVKYFELERGDDSEKLNSFLRKILVKEKKNRLKLNEITDELKKLNEPHLKLKLIPFEEEEIKIDEYLSINNNKYNIKLEVRINSVFHWFKKENGNCLNFEKLSMGDVGMKYLCSRLETMNNVTGISISYNNLSSNGLNMFSKCLKFFPSLRCLWLGGNEIGNGGLKVFSENLHFISRLRWLGLNNCGLVDDDIKDLSSHFKDIHYLEGLWIDSDEGVRYLCENINEIMFLIGLYMNRNEVSDVGGEILLNTLPKCRRLIELFIAQNRISNYDDFRIKMKEKHPNEYFSIYTY